MKRFAPKGFTIVELTVVIVIIGILAGLVALGWSGWQKRIAESEVKSELNGLLASLSSYKNFNNGYPALSAGTTFDSNGPIANQNLFKTSSGVKITYYAGDSTTYCIDAVSLRVPTVGFFIDTSPTNGNGKVQAGTCSGDPIAPPATSGYIAVSSSQSNTCAIAYTNKAYCWGANTTNQLGNGNTTGSQVPTAVSTAGLLSGKTIKTIGTGASGSCALTTDNGMFCWGLNTYGQLGTNNSVDSAVPTAVSMTNGLAGKTIKSMSVGSRVTCVVASDDKAYCWGYGAFGQLGGGSYYNSFIPTTVSTTGVLSGKTIKSISANSTHHTCVVASDDKAYCWGANGNGQYGDGSVNTSATPVAVSFAGVLSGKTIKMISTGTNHTCAVASDNNAYCWGDSSNGRLGNGMSGTQSFPTTVTVSGPLFGKTIKSISAGGSHTCAIASDDNAYCWGANSYGQLGNNTYTGSSSAVAVTTSGVLSGKSIKAITAGSDHTCVITTDSNAYCWGRNDSGKLGNNSTTNSPVPVAVDAAP